MNSLRQLFWPLMALGLCAGCASRQPDDREAEPVSASASLAGDSKPAAAGLPAEVLETTAAARAAQPDDWFEDVTATSGLSFTYHNGMESGQYAMVESMGGGVALWDYDRDGDLDVYVTGGGSITEGQIPQGRAGALFRNDGDWRFADVTTAVGLDRVGDYSHGATVADYDRDGWPDLFVTCYGRCQLFRNVEGQRFDDVTEVAGLELDGWYTAATFLDFNRDGRPDLYVCGYVDWRPGSFKAIGDQRDVNQPDDVPALPDRLFRGDATGRFTDVTEAAGIRKDGKGLGVVAADLNADEWIDIYVANDVVNNHLYLGGPTLPLEEVGLSAGVSGSEYGVPEGSMGVDAGDFDGDGLLDLFVTNYELEDNSLYRNEGNALFLHRTTLAGLAGRCRPFVGFATEFVDFDLDGWLDLYVLNGHVAYRARQSPYRQPAVFYRNQSGRRFEDISNLAAPYFSVTHVGRGGAHGDLDNDGDEDLILVHQNEPVTVLRNRRNPSNWLGVSLEGVDSHRDVIGAVVMAEFEGRQLTRVVRGGGSYLSCSDRRVLLPATMDAHTIRVQWPNGRLETFPGLEPGRYHHLREGDGQSEDGSAAAN